MISVIGVRYSFISCESSSGRRLSEMVVKLRTSENSTVISLFSLPMAIASGFSLSSATSSGGMYWLNCPASLRLPRSSTR